jgi:hypothetical protein
VTKPGFSPVLRQFAHARIRTFRLGAGDSDKILTDSKAGMLVNEFNDKEYNRIIDQIDVLLKIDKTKITEASVQYFSLNKGIELHDYVYQKLIN